MAKKEAGPEAAAATPGRPPGALPRKSGKAAGPKKALTGRQKAAIFIITLGHEIAAEIFKHLRDDEIEQLTFEIARNETIDPGDARPGADGVPGADDGPGLHLHRRHRVRPGAAGEGLGSQKAVDIINRLTSSLQVRPFDFIRRTDPAHLLNFIQQEHPQTIALILAYLEPNKASVILGALPSEIQSDVAKRIATMDRTSPEVLREVERVLEKKLSTLSSRGLHHRRRRGEHRGDPEPGGPLHGEGHHRGAWRRTTRSWPRTSRSACSSSRTSCCWTTGPSRRCCARWTPRSWPRP